MEFEFDRYLTLEDDELCNVYVRLNDKRRCIGRIVRKKGGLIWNVYADGLPLTAATDPVIAAHKLWKLFCIQHPGKAGLPKKEIWECSVEERLTRIRKRIPKHAHLNETVVRQARDIPVDRRQSFLQNVDDLIGDLEEHIAWWRKVRDEARKAPRFTVYR